MLFFNRSAAVLLYRRESLEEYMEQEQVKRMLHKLGYQDTSLEAVLPVFRMRYRRYMQERRISLMRWDCFWVIRWRM